jgi:hypothetical protein
MTRQAEHITSHRLYPAALQLLKLSPSEVQHIGTCRFCNEIFEFFSSANDQRNGSAALGTPHPEELVAS